MAILKSTSTPAEQRTQRMLLIGLLLLLAPCLFVLLVGALISPSIAAATLPRELQPVPAVGPGDSLVLVASFAGSGGVDPAVGIDRAALSVVYDNYYGNDTQVGRITATPTSHAEALALAAQHNASLVVWGTYDASTAHIHFSLPENLVISDLSHLVFDADRSEADLEENIGQAALGILLATKVVDEPYRAYDASYQLQGAFQGGTPTLHDEQIALYLAEMQYQSGDLYAVLQTLDAINFTAPLDLHAYILRAAVNNDLGMVDEALAALEQVFAIDPNQPDAWATYGRLLVLSGQLEEGLDGLNQALEVEPANTDLLWERAQVYTALERYPEAIADYEALSRIGPDLVNYHVRRARLEALQGNLEAALAALDQADEVISSDVYTVDEDIILIGRTRAELYLANQDYDAALAAYQSLPTYTPAYLYGPGIVFWEMGDHEAAVAAWDETLPTAPSGDALNSLAWELAQLGHYEGALPYAERAVSISSQNPSIVHTRGFIQLGLGNYAEALTDFEEAERGGVGSYYTEIYRDLGDAYLALDQYRDAIISYEQYLDINPSAEDAFEVRQHIERAEQAQQAR